MTELMIKEGCDGMKKESVLVIGACNIDICGQSFAPLIPRDSNPGFAKTGLGGVGRNIAHNLALLDVPVSFLTALGDDGYARLIEQSCAQTGIDISRALTVKGVPSSCYIFINGPDSDMALAVSDMALCENITAGYLSDNRALIEAAKLIVIDANLPEEAVAFLTACRPGAIFADPVSVTKAARIKPYLCFMHTVKPNLQEAEVLSGITIKDEASLKEAADTILAAGLKRVFISLGDKGVYAAERQAAFLIPCLPAAVKNTTGAGDAFMAGAVRATLNGKDLRNTALFASAAAGLAIEAKETINPRLSVKAVRDKLRQGGIL